MLVIVSPVTFGGSFTALTVSTNVSTAVWPFVAVTVTVIVVLPFWSAAGVICSVREPPDPVKLRFAFRFGTSVVLDDEAVTVLIREPVPSPRLKVTFLTPTRRMVTSCSFTESTRLAA